MVYDEEFKLGFKSLLKCISLRQFDLLEKIHLYVVLVVYRAPKSGLWWSRAFVVCLHNCNLKAIADHSSLVSPPP